MYGTLLPLKTIVHKIHHNDDQSGAYSTTEYWCHNRCCSGFNTRPCWMLTIRLAEYQQKLARCYNRDVKTREFSARNQVLWKSVGNMRDTNAGKLAATWEGPYRVTAIAGTGAYYLEDLDERPLPRPWNIHHLKKFYQ